MMEMVTSDMIMFATTEQKLRTYARKLVRLPATDPKIKQHMIFSS